MSMTIIEKHQSELKKRYEILTGEKNGIVSFCDTEYNNFELHVKNFRKDVKSFQVVQVEILESNIPYFYWSSGFKNNNKKTKTTKYKYSGPRTGFFKITCTEKDKTYIILFCCFLYGVKLDTVNLLCGSEYALSKLMNMEQERNYKAQKPPIGIFHGEVPHGSNILRYIKKDINKNQKPIYHSTKKSIEDDMKYFFDNVGRSIKNGEKGTRKILIAGVQGTGKSSFIEILTIDNKDKYSILFCKNLNELVLHLQGCSKYKVPCISILEDCENYLTDNSSELLNFFSGNLEPINTAGSYTILTTNHPDRLSDRIKNRPERVDDIYILSKLNANDALLVTKQYFSKFLPEDFNYETLRGLFEGYTGAEIMKIAQDVKKAADYKFGEFSKVDLKFIEQIISLQFEKYKKLSQVDTATTKTAKANTGFNSTPVGFGSHEIEYEEGY